MIESDKLTQSPRMCFLVKKDSQDTIRKNFPEALVIEPQRIDTIFTKPSGSNSNEYTTSLAQKDNTYAKWLLSTDLEVKFNQDGNVDYDEVSLFNQPDDTFVIDTIETWINKIVTSKDEYLLVFDCQCLFTVKELHLLHNYTDQNVDQLMYDDLANYVMDGVGRLSQFKFFFERVLDCKNLTVLFTTSFENLPFNKHKSDREKEEFRAYQQQICEILKHITNLPDIYPLNSTNIKLGRFFLAQTRTPEETKKAVDEINTPFDDTRDIESYTSVNKSYPELPDSKYFSAKTTQEGGKSRRRKNKKTKKTKTTKKTKKRRRSYS
jgi:hypothetical protein